MVPDPTSPLQPLYADPAYVRILEASRGSASCLLYAEAVWVDAACRRVAASTQLLHLRRQQDRAETAAAAASDPSLVADHRADLARWADASHGLLEAARAAELEAISAVLEAVRASMAADAEVTRYLHARSAARAGGEL